MLAGIGNITLSQLTDASGGTISISGSGGGADFSLGVSGGNTAGQTGVTGTRVALAGGNGVTLSQLTDANGGSITISGITQSVQTQDRFDLTLDGNTAGVLQLVSSGTLTLAGGTNITLSQNGNAISIVGAAGGAETQTAISGVAASNTTYTSGTITITGVGGGITVSSNTGQRIDLSVAAPVAQTGTQFSAGVSGGNTSGHSGTVPGRVVLAGGNNITLSGSTNGASMSITVSGANLGGAQTGISGIAASNTTYTSGSVTFTGVGGGVTVSSNTGQRVDISVAAPVAQTNQAGSLFAVGNTTSSTSGTYDARTLSLRGDGMISIAATNSGFRISATQSNQAGSLFAVGNTTSSSSGTYDARTLSLRGDGIVSIAATNSGFRISASQSVQTQNMVAVTLSGNTSGAQALISSGTMTLAGGNNITVSQNGNAVTISGPNVGGAQTGISSIVASNTTYTSGQVEFTGSGIVTVRSSAGQRVVIDASQSVQTQGVFSAGVSTGGNTDGATGVSGTRMVLVGEGVLTLSQTTGAAGNTVSIQAPATSVLSAVAPLSTSTNGSTISILGPPSFSAGVSTVGNSSGDTGITGSRLVFAGGNNITLSQSTNASGGTITVSGPNVGGAQTGISGIANSQTTYTSGTVSLSELGAITIRSTTGNQFQLSVNSQTDQTLGLYAVGNTTGQSSSTTRDARTLSFRGAGDVSVGYSNSSIMISAPAQTAQTGISGIANSQTTYTSGTVSLSELGAITIRSTTGNQFQLSVNAQTGTQFSAGLTNSGNTSGDTGTVGGRLLLVGTNNITLSGSTNGASMTITMSGPTVGGAQTGISGLANSQTTYTSGTVSLSELGAITIRSTTGNQFQFSVNSQSNQSEGWYALGNTTGQSSSTTLDARTISLRGDGIVSLGYSNGSLRISASQSVQPETQTAISGIANSQTTYTSGTVSLSELGAITIRSTTGNQFQFSVNAQTAESQSIGMSNLGNTSGTTGIASGAQVRFLFAGGNNITLSQSLNGASGTITISGPNTAAQSNQTLGMYAVQNTTGQSSSTTMDARTLSVAGDGAVSVGYSAGSLRISAPTQTVQTQGILSAGVSTGGNTLGNTQVSTGSRLVLVGSGMITASQATAAGASTITLNATQSAESQSIGMSNLGNTSGTTGIASGAQVRMLFAGGNNITLSQSLNGASGTLTIIGGAGGAGFSAGVSTGGNTAGATGVSGTQMVLVGSNNVTLSQTTGANGNTVSVVVPDVSAISAVAPLSTSTNGSTISILGPAQLSVGFSTQGNTAGDTGFVTARLALVGGNNITLSGSTNAGSQTITISGGAGGGFSAGVSNVGNTQGDTGVTGTRLVLAGTNNITLSQSTDANGATVRISGQSPAGGQFSAGVSNLGNTAGATGITGSQQVFVGSGVVSLSQTTGANGGTVSILAPATSSLVGTNGVSVSTNGSTISVMGDTRTFFAPYDESPMVTGQQGQQTIHVMPMFIPNLQFDRILVGVQISNATNSSNSITLTQYVGIYTKNASTLSLLSSTSTSYNFSGSGTVGSYSLYGGPRQLSIPWTVTLTASDYYIAMNLRTTTGAGAGHSISQLLQSKFTNSDWSGLLGAASTLSAQRLLGQGVYSATSAGVPNSMAFTDIRGTGSLVLRAPIFHFRSGTV